MIDWTKPIETVDGRAANWVRYEPEKFWRIVYTAPDYLRGIEPDVFLVNFEGWRRDDALSSKRREGQKPFIRNVRVKRVAWCLVSPKYCIVNRKEYYRTEELAREAALPDERIAKMEWEG
ncbi:hypothetical protein UFOVP670_35 [uncultured Caudovirales phage]|uniref:Uncharacterized protein n=1 Tax=uncultured Caudovirales phage TaxID=2100421 RepID=A0A6J5ND10_9CAUD|nr:hypothetical protein UFOVP670_35 [uncultured Caudovirales phage]